MSTNPKTTHLIPVLWVVLTLLLISCQSQISSPSPQPSPSHQPSPSPQPTLPRLTTPGAPSQDISQLVSDNNAFALDFYQQIRSLDGNQFFSPYSISLALAMTYAGANGQTAQQMASALHYSLPPEQLHPAFNALDLDITNRTSGTKEGNFQLNIANALWGQQGFPFLITYLDLLAQNYGAGLHQADFAQNPENSRQDINQWISQQTNDKIKDMIPAGAIDPSTRLVLANAIYFKANWNYPFDETLTRPGTFNRLDGSQISVPMMSFSEGKIIHYFQGDGFQAIEIPYGGLGSSAEMLILLPDQGKFTQFEALLTSEQLQTIGTNLQSNFIILHLPKFSFDASYDLNQTFQQLGMSDAFDPTTADFSGMDGKLDLFIGAVLHKAFISVDETGTEAAAATVTIMPVSLPVGTPAELTIDRPFIFAIRDQPSGTILFLGRVLDPSK